MRILIEEYQYDVTKVKEILQGIGALENIEGKVSIHYVGYFYNTTIQDCVFILPKVLMDENDKVFGKYDPADIIHLEGGNNPLNKQENNGKQELSFIYELSVWVYRAINVFKEYNRDSQIVLFKQIAQVGQGKRHLNNMFLDILLSLLKFNRENQDFFFFTIKNTHKGHNKINWTKTLSHSQAFMQNSEPIYLNPVNKRRLVNFDEELMVIFLSILNYIHKEYGFPFKTEFNYELISGPQFKHYLNGYGKRRLREIKYKYFSDKALELWNLCYAFFEKASKIRENSEENEYLLAKNFEIVFEDIIDELLGGRNDELPEELKDQPDGKRVDHLYRYKSLIESDDENIYYIGDSKYYKRDTKIGEEARYKQFTYARNVIQWNLDLFLDEKQIVEQKAEERKGTGMLRDKLTEGYNIIPNFFISAQQKDLKKNDKITWVDKDQKNFSSRQFDNRLFDRDTLLICHYDVNFLYVVSLYGRKNEGEKNSWRGKVKKQFRQETINHIESRFDFHVLVPKGNLEDLIERNFKKLNGKIYQPNGADNLLILALDKGKNFQFENLQLISEIEKDFHIYEYHLGNDPEEAGKTIPYQYWEIPQLMAAENNSKEETQYPKGKTIEYKKYHKTSVLFGIFKNEEHKNWILKEKRYNVRLGERAGAVKRTRQVTSAQYLVLYNLKDESQYEVYKLSNKHEIWDEQKMKATNYPMDDDKKKQYYIYTIEGKTDELAKVDVKATLEREHQEFKDNTKEEIRKGAPIYVYEGEIIRESFVDKDA